jgi:signal transduction histidine kinase
MTMRALRRRLTWIAVRPHLPRRTIRLQLTAIYGGLFLICGAGLLAITYVLVDKALPNVYTWSNGHGKGSVTIGAGGPSTGSGPVAALIASEHVAELNQLLLDSGIALGMMAIVSIVLGWVVAGRVLRPLRTITSAARDISATNLHRRLALAGPNDELKELGDTFDDLLARLERAFRSQRQFVANASHELRTPIAWQRTLVQVALGDPDADATSLRAAHEKVLASGAQQERLIEALLALTRGQAGLEKRELIDLRDVAGRVLVARQAEAQDRTVDVHSALAPAPISGEPRLVERLVANLVDNAVRHNVVPGRLDVVTGRRNGRAFVSVVNTGPVVPSGAVGRLLQPFQRIGSDRTRHGEGLGLGLSIVQAIAEAHDAVLALRPRAGGGLEVEVSFSEASSAAASHVTGVELPLIRRPLAREAAAADVGLPVDPRRCLPDPSALLAEDPP